MVPLCSGWPHNIGRIMFNLEGHILGWKHLYMAVPDFEVS